VVAAQQAGCLGGLAGGVLDRLGLVQDQIVEFHLAQQDHVLAQGAVGGDHQVAIPERIDLPGPAGAGMVEHAQGRGEAGRLGQPVEDQRAGHHHQGRRELLFRGGGPALAAGFQQGEHLDGLAEPHVVRETPAEAEVAQEVEPPQAGALIGAELAVEPRRRIGRRHPRELVEPPAGALEGLIRAY
jgi:hypothetical protein